MTRPADPADSAGRGAGPGGAGPARRCGHWTRAHPERCGSLDGVHLYAVGPLCRAHTPPGAEPLRPVVDPRLAGRYGRRGESLAAGGRRLRPPTGRERHGG